MTINVRKKGKICILEVSGQFKSDNCTALGTKCKELVEAGERLFVLNMLDVPWMDTLGMAEILVCHKRIGDVKGTLKLVVRGKAHELIIIVHLHKIMEVFEDMEAALASFAS